MLSYRGHIPGFERLVCGGASRRIDSWGASRSSPVIAMAGRFHRYEGWSNEQDCVSCQVNGSTWCPVELIVSNAAGGVNPKFRVGDIVVIRDHLNFMGLL